MLGSSVISLIFSIALFSFAIFQGFRANIFALNSETRLPQPTFNFSAYRPVDWTTVRDRNGIISTNVDNSNQDPFSPKLKGSILQKHSSLDPNEQDEVDIPHKDLSVTNSQQEEASGLSFGEKLWLTFTANGNNGAKPTSNIATDSSEVNTNSNTKSNTNINTNINTNTNTYTSTTASINSNGFGDNSVTHNNNNHENVESADTSVVAALEPSETPYRRTVCKYNIKIYVYELPKTLLAVQLGEEARRNGTLHVCQKCILEQFALEYIVNDFFSQFCGRTMNPDEADFFYLPLIRDAEYRVALSGSHHNRAPSATEEALIAMIEKKDSSKWKQTFQVTDKYWNAKDGADHIIVMPAPVTNFRHESSKRGFFHYMPHLHTPIFLGVEYSLTFIKEYPICATKKNIVVPYPTTDPDLFNGNLMRGSVSRSGLLYYAGGMHGDCIEVRKAIKQVMINSTKIPGVTPNIPSNQAEREHGFRAAVFCPIPIGDSPSSKRMYDVLNFGCIPVVLSDDIIWAYSEDTGGPFAKSSYAIQLPQSIIQHSSQYVLKQYAQNTSALGSTPSGAKYYDMLQAGVTIDGDYFQGIYINPLVHILRRVPPRDIAYLQVGVRRVAPYFRFYAMNHRMTRIPTADAVIPDGAAMEVIVDALEKRKRIGIEWIRDQCMAEKAMKHSYQWRYPCDNTYGRRRRLLRHDNDESRRALTDEEEFSLENRRLETSMQCLIE